MPPKLSDITSLFAKLASTTTTSLETLDPTARIEDDEDLTITISNLNRSLNLTQTEPRLRVLDTALALMCFTAPQVFESVFECTVKTIVAVLSSSIECKVLRSGKKEVLRVGGSISSMDSVEIIESCVDILEKLEGHHGDLSPSIIYAALRVAVLSSRFVNTSESSAILDFKKVDGWKVSLRKLLVHVPKEVKCTSREIPVRLLFWYLDPFILKRDISQILQEAIKRPLLCLSMAFYERTEWHSVLICLALAPAMFIEARALLHNWFLLTGLTSVLRLQNELISLVLDIVSRPISWGLSMEIGSKMPFSHTYFPYKQKLLRILSGPITWESFQNVVHKISNSSSNAGKHHNGSSEQGSMKIELVDHRSIWAIVMNFPHWFSFACLLLFSGPHFQGHFNLKYLIGSTETDKSYNVEVPYSAAAARFIAWILSPATESYQDLLVDYITKLSGLWTLKQFSSGRCNHTARGYKVERELESDYLDNRVLKYDRNSIWLWLNKFQDMCIRYCRQVTGFASSAGQTSQEDGNQQSLLLRRIPLGILIGFFDSIDEVGCELLLHYAATGTIFLWTEAQLTELKHRRRISEWHEGSTKWSETCSAEEAVAGASVVFHLTDAAEKMSTSLFETEESGLNFLHGVKLKVGNYLLKCIRRILQLKTVEEAKLLMFRDLCQSLLRWGHQGQDVFQDYKDLDDVIEALRCA
ncbi:hypothetical protein ACH5RR_006134 [Cinchona calisaya]|uniref:Uncharacterized protein n=1 Tax=Cinchona calisaya TaxID=153742 RepID=A0ABD3AN52_9GENT